MPTIQIRDDKAAFRVQDMPDDNVLTVEEAVNLARDLIDAVSQCGHDVRMSVQIPMPSEAKIAAAVSRVGHMRRNSANTHWSNGKVNHEIVQRVLEVCL